MVVPLLELRNITKSFGTKVANDDVSLTLLPGRVHALVGENGAGKTTLMTMVAGTQKADSGEIYFHGDLVSIDSPQQASAMGIGMVHQHFKLVPSLTVAANIFLGQEMATLGRLDSAAMEDRVRELSSEYGLEIDPTAEVSTLSVGLRQRVEILKALSHDTQLLILDEPTAVLTPSEADDLFVVVHDLAAKGRAILFISHKLDEVRAISDDITVIRDGRVIDTMPAAGLTNADIARKMVGRDVLLRIDHTPPQPGDTMLDVSDVSVLDDRGVRVVDRISLQVRSGEIVGIAGVEGNGQSELAEVIAGLDDALGGTVTMAGRNVTADTVADRRALGMSFIPEDRHEVGTGPELSVAENIAVTLLKEPVAKRGWINTAAMTDLASRLIKRFDVRGAAPETTIEDLSGGNMQKVVIAREFESDPKLLIVSQPTRGVDVGAMEFVHNAIVARRDAGAAVLLLSADLNEVMSLSDRLLVMYRGRIVAEFTQDNMSETAIGLAMSGSVPDEEAIAAAREEHQRKLQAVAAPLDVVLDEAPGTSALTGPDADPGPEQVVTSEGPTVGLVDATDAPTGEDAVVDAMRNQGGRSRTGQLLADIVSSAQQPLLAIGIALVLGAVMMLAIGADPLVAYTELFFSAFVSAPAFSSLIAQFTPLFVMAVAVIVSFRAGLFNIGGEGQLFIGAFSAAWVGFTFTSLPGFILMPLMIVAGLAGGMVWGIVPGWLLARWKVDIVVVTLMMSTIATLLTGFFVTGPFRDPNVGMPASVKLAPQSRLPQIIPNLGIGLDTVIAVAVGLFVAFLLTRSVWGLRVRQVGELNRFAEYSGVSPRRMAVEVMALSGAVSGMAGALYVMGPHGGRFIQQFSPGYGFLAITVALLARLNPFAAILAALFYADLMAGSNSMQIYAGVPFPLVSVLQGILVLLLTAHLSLSWLKRRKNAQNPTPAAAVASTPAAKVGTTEGSAA